MKNELNQHKRSDKIKWIITGVAFVLVFVMLVGVIMQIFGKGKVKPSEWFKKPETEQTQTSADDIVITPIESNGIELCSAAVPLAAYESYGIDPQSVENVFELSVTYTPANTTFQETDYTISFKNANSTWATGKNVTNYATLQHEDGSKNAVLTVKQAFGEQIIVKAVSQRDNSKMATFTVDYVMNDISGSIADFADIDSSSTITLYYSNGTVNPLGSPNTAYYDFDFGCLLGMAEYGFTLSSTVYRHNFDLENDVSTYETPTIREMIMHLGGEAATNDPTGYWNAACYCMLGGSDPSDMSGGEVFSTSLLGVTRIYQDVNYGDVDDGGCCDSVFLTDWSGFEISATTLTPNNSHIVAG